MSDPSTQKIKSMSEAASQYQEYHDSVRPPEAPRGNISEIELIAQTFTLRIWAMRTKHPLSAVLTENFFDGMTDLRLRKEDRIELVASFGAERGEHCTLVVDEVDKAGHAKLSLLHRYERNE
jgi:hypothetical protein